LIIKLGLKPLFDSAFREAVKSQARIKGDETTLDIANRINPIIKKYPFRVRIKYSEEFSIPVVEWKERTEREKLIESFVNEFKQIIKTIDGDGNSLPQTNYILDCEVEFTKSCKQQGYYAGGWTSAVTDPAKTIQPQIQKELERKANKRKKWKDLHKTFPYLVAVDIQQDFYFEDNLIPFLFGGKCYNLPDYFGNPGDPSFPKYSELPIVTEAKEHGWKDFLEKVGFDPRSQSPIPINHEGILIKNVDVFKNVSGIITRIGSNFQFVPNPFAEEQINHPDLQEIIPWRSVEEIYEINKQAD
jgi:hypothetical protein